MHTLKPEDFATEQQIARNHARVSAFRDRTSDLLTEDLCLVSQEIKTHALKSAPAPDNQSAFAF